VKKVGVWELGKKFIKINLLYHVRCSRFVLKELESLLNVQLGEHLLKINGKTYFEQRKMAKIKLANIFLNCGRNIILSMPPQVQKVAAMKDAKMLIIAKALKRGVFDYDIPDKLVSEEMAERYLEIAPPVASIIPDYQLVINEIEQSYVIGNDFSALSASCVVIERLLNKARMDLHKHHKDKVVKGLWNKDAVNEWYPNINALKEWGYLDDAFASELSDIYVEIRCRYLHSGEIQNIRHDALRAIAAAYKLMKIFIGFPEDLFSWTGGGPRCMNETDPRFLEFYKPYIQEG
jgi:hypothetical protein